MRGAPLPAGRRRAVSVAILAALAAGCAGSAAPPGAAPALRDTYWALLEIDGNTFLEYRGTREPHVVFRSEGTRVTGFSGCNNMAGMYEATGASLHIRPLALTRMACTEAESAVMESALLRALDQTESYRIRGTTLELRDAAGAPRVRLEARGTPR